MRLSTLMLATTFAALATFHSATTQACGGFFCDSVTPVDQSSEDILFYAEPDIGRVRAVITIQYQGEAADFSWILPVNSVPEVSFSTDQVFRAVRTATDLVFSSPVERRNCVEVPQAPNGGMFADSFATESADSSSGGAGGGGPTVTVLASGQTGPYDYVVLKSADTPALVTWLKDNGYTVPPTSEPLMDHYTVQGMAFVAVKLQKSASSGDILPIVLDMKEPEPCVPIVLTQVAARPDMPIRIWVAGPGRALPRNWFHVEPNWMRLNWAAPATMSSVAGVVSYNGLVRRAVDEGAGRAFITEFAGPGAQAATAAKNRANQIENAGKKSNVSSMLSQLSTALGGLPPDVIGWLAEVMPLPTELEEKGVTPAQYFGSPWMYENDYESMNYDLDAVRERIHERLVKPLRDAQRWLEDTPWLTRLYTQISPHEMTRDPFFVFSDQWPTVSNQRSGTRVNDCAGTTDVVIRYIEVDGGPSFIDPLSEPDLWANNEPSLPWASQVVLEVPGEGGFPVKPQDVPYVDGQIGMVSAALITSELDPADPFMVPAAFRIGGTPGSGGELAQPDSPGNNGQMGRSQSRGGCSQGAGAAGGGILFLSLLALGGFRGAGRWGRGGG